MGFLPWEIRVASPGESQLQQSRATQPTVHARCFSVSIIHRTLTWTRRSLTCAQTLMHAIAHWGVRTHVRESALKVDSGRKIPCCTGESNLRQRRDGPMLYQLSYVPTSSPIWSYLLTFLLVTCTPKVGDFRSGSTERVRLQSLQAPELVFEERKATLITSNKMERVTMMMEVLHDFSEPEISQENQDHVSSVYV